MNFSEAMRNEETWTRTENGAVAKNTTGNACLDLFSTIGALRDADKTRICTLFDEAYKEDPLMATKILFYGRDIREGLGERETFKTIVQHCAVYHPEAIRYNIRYFGEYGRFDDWYSLVDTPLELNMWGEMSKQLYRDRCNALSGKPISLLPKWMKSVNTHRKKTKELGIKTANALGFGTISYRKILKDLRKYLDITEIKMSTNKWNEIDYSKVPGRAMNIYSNAFKKHDEERYKDFINKAINGDVKINSSTLYPYDLIGKIFRFDGWYQSQGVVKEDATVEAQWRQLPNYVEPGTNAIVIADTSGSMIGRPINTSIGLAIYFAEHNTGAYHNLFMSFSSSPTIHKIKGDTLTEKIRSIDMSDWANSTDLKEAFDKILDIAIENDVPPDEMPKSIIVISDMEIDNCGNRQWTFYDKMQHRFEKYGYQIPLIIFWNVNSRNNIFHTDANRKGVQLVSGQSTTVFKQLIDSIGKTPVDMMKQVINSERYAPITIVNKC